MEENGNANGETKARELTSIAITPYPDWEGKTTTTDKRYGDKEHKFSISVPVPSTDEEAQELYGVSLESLTEAGVIQKWYGARDVDNVIKEAFGNAQDPNSDDVIEVVTIAACEQRFEAKARVSQAKETKKWASEVKASGMTYQEAIAAMKTLAALKAKGIDINSL